MAGQKKKYFWIAVDLYKILAIGRQAVYQDRPFKDSGR